jgi:hypothetical protein
VQLCRDADAVGADVEGVHDPHARGVKVCTDRGVRGADVAASATDEVGGTGERLGDAKQPLVAGPVAGPSPPDLVAVHRLTHRLQPRHGDAVDRARDTSDGLGKGGPEFGSGLDLMILCRTDRPGRPGRAIL